eukprot:3978420-Heterocapsa_arctica.AAC.1
MTAAAIKITRTISWVRHLASRTGANEARALLHKLDTPRWPGLLMIVMNDTNNSSNNNNDDDADDDDDNETTTNTAD